MVDLVITAATVVAGTNAIRETGSAGETIAAGQAVYKNTTTNKYMLADSNSVTAEARRSVGIALNGAALNQPVAVQTGGDITAGGTLTPGVAYYLSDTPGGLCLVADVGAGEYVCLIGIAKSAAILGIDVQFPNVAL